ncbi:MAG: hypothetical protein ACFE9I_10090 [Candidatus Hermodarchaeota archaeon]
MDKKRILIEAQKIAKEFSFWMVSGNIAHLYGYVYEREEKKYEIEIKFDENFPNSPPELVYHNEIKELLGEFQLNSCNNWTVNSSVIDIIHELKAKIEDRLGLTKENAKKQILPIQEQQVIDDSSKEQYITPDLNAYPPDFQYDEYTSTSDSANDLYYDEKTYDSASEPLEPSLIEQSDQESKISIQEDYSEDIEQLSLEINTELGLIQQEYAYDQPDSKRAVINVYITITLAKTFILSIDLMNYPEKPKIDFPNEIKNLLGDPYKTLDTLRNWNLKKPIHIVDILHELEKKLFFIKDIEIQLKEISGEYRSENVPSSLTKLKVHLLTYGFMEYTMTIDLEPYPKQPNIELSSDLQEIIKTQIIDLNSYKNWREEESEPIEIVREISWLVDKNSRINFEIDLLKDHYKNIKYDPLTTTLRVEMKGKMKTEDLMFDFQINLPSDYPMKMPQIKVINEFEIEAHEKIKNDLHTSFDDFFNEWNPFSYLIDLFNLISKKIFEVSVIACVICHKIECPSCTKKIAGENNCHTECPHCNRAYHNHCWEQTIKSFGKCGFCLR